MAPISKCLLLALLVAALARCVEPRSRPTNTTTVFHGDRVGRGRWPAVAAAAQAAVRARRPLRLMRPRDCVTIRELLHGEAYCNNRGCNLTCNAGYEFGNTVAKGRTLALRCDASSGALLVEGRRWTPGTTLCTPVLCATPCQNGGTCVARNRCACPGAYTGHTCSEFITVGDQPYRNYYPGVLAPNQRRVECELGTRMPDGSTSVTLSFRDNSWFFPDGRLLLGADQVTCEKASVTTESYSNTPEETKPSSRLPNPEPLLAATSSPPIHCHPPCQNGGQCVYTDTCSCPRGFWGPSCQVKTCTYPRFQTNLNASLGGTLKKMKFECHPGHHTRQGHDRIVIICQNGLWKLPSGRMLVEEDVKCIRD